MAPFLPPAGSRLTTPPIYVVVPWLVRFPRGLPLPRYGSGVRGLRFQGASDRAGRSRGVSPSGGRDPGRRRSWRRRGPTSLCLPRIMLVQATEPDRLPVGHAGILARHGLSSPSRTANHL